MSKKFGLYFDDSFLENLIQHFEKFLKSENFQIYMNNFFEQMSSNRLRTKSASKFLLFGKIIKFEKKRQQQNLIQKVCQNSKKKLSYL